ncbi:MAG: aminoglycoside phosphotransferase family protein [Chloroflexi bacterium]|nr:MAG: aminoglycoside phosphotransferase family protein [Chloroflexota bacterium]
MDESRTPLTGLLDWCQAILGPLQLISDSSREHPGQRTGALRLRAESGDYYLKIHREQAGWHNEVHAYRAWASAFGGFAPRLLAAHDAEPLALLLSALPGRILEEVRLPAAQELAVWRRAGEALAALHTCAAGDFFGPCLRDGSPAGKRLTAAQAYVGAELEGWLERGMRAGCLTGDEMVLVERARGLLAAFAGERPLPCHRDYGPANWLVDGDGRWAGVIDFEFAHWDVRVADFTRYPNWEWLLRPALTEAFDAGYGHVFSHAEEAQRLLGHILYALAAVVWGAENQYHGFAAEGRQALARLAEMVDA